MSTPDKNVHIIPWTIPKPMGLWYQAFVLTKQGIYITPEVDFTTLEQLKAALDGGADAVVRVLTEHGRSKRSHFIPIEAVAGVAANEAAGTIHLKVNDDALDNPMVRIPKREQLPKIAQALTTFVKRTRGLESSPS